MMTYKPFRFIEPPPPVIDFPAFASTEDNIYGDEFWRECDLFARFDGEVFSVYEGERLLYTTKDRSKLVKFLEVIR